MKRVLYGALIQVWSSLRSRTSFARPLRALVVVGLAAGCAAPPQGLTAEVNKKEPKPGSFGGEEGATPPGTTAAGQPSEVWGHSADTLFRLDPTSKAITIVGTFSGCRDDVTDIALDESSRIFATTAEGLYTVDKATAACTRIATGSYPNSLSFVPKGTVDPNAEALVGYEEGQYVRIDPTSGAKTVIGRLGGELVSSGDIVSVKGGATYLTVTDGECSDSDCLVEVDPTSGAMLKNWGPIGRTEVFGLAFWAGSVFGFDSQGALFEVSFDGGKLATKAIPVTTSGGATSFWGAGSTTSAPVTAVK
jgi:hypothetical protein